MNRHQRLDLRQRSNTCLLITNESNDRISEKKKEILSEHAYIFRNRNDTTIQLGFYSVKLFPVAEVARQATLFTAINAYKYKSTRKTEVSVKVTQFGVSNDR